MVGVFREGRLLMGHVGDSRGYRLRGGEFDVEKAAHTLLLDYRSGALGRISLETPQSRVELLASYVPPPMLGEPQDEEDEEVQEGHGRYWCSTDKRWKERKGPKQSRG